MAIKLLQCNIWGGRLEKQILGLVADQDPDILCLQEAISVKGGSSGMFATVEEIQTAIGANYVYHSPTFGYQLMSRRADFGNTIISKFPFVSSETLFTGREYIPNFDIVSHSPNMRNLQHVVITLPARQELHVFNHHGHHIPEHKNGDAETIKQCRLIVGEIKKLGIDDTKIILTGDFNLSPHSESLEQLNAVLRNLSIEAKLKTTRTALTHKTEVCDYVFVSPAVKVQSFTALNDLASDHRALLVNFR